MAAIIVLEHDRVLLPAPESLFDYTGREPANRDAAPMPGLIELLRDTDPRVRRRAALAVGRVGLIAGGPSLRDALTDPNPDVRQMSAFALGLLADPEAKESLMLALNDVDPLTRGRSAEALARLDAHEAAPAIGAMVQVVTTQASQVPQDDLTYPQSPEVEAFRMGVTALALLDAYEPLAMAVLSPAGELNVRWWLGRCNISQTRAVSIHCGNSCKDREVMRSPSRRVGSGHWKIVEPWNFYCHYSTRHVTILTLSYRLYVP
jgi:hypothetical protein